MILTSWDCLLTAWADWSSFLSLSNPMLKVYSPLRIHSNSKLLITDAEGLMSRMEKEGGIKPDAVTWNSLVYGYAACWKTEKALDVLEKVKKNKVEPNMVSWTAVLSGWSTYTCTSWGSVWNMWVVKNEIYK